MTNTIEQTNAAPVEKDPKVVFKDAEELFEALADGAPFFELVPCTVNGEHSAAICLVEMKFLNGMPGFALTPVFVAVTDGMKLLNEAGEEPKTTADYEAEAEASKDAPTTDDSASEDQRQAA